MLATTLVSSGLVRLLGALVFLELALRKRESRHMILFYGWAIYAIGPLAGSSWGLDSPVFGASAVAGTVVLIAGALSYFRDMGASRVLVLAGVLAVVTTAVSMLVPGAGALAIVGAQGLALTIAAIAALTARQEFVAVAPGSYIWLVTLAALGTAHAVGFVTLYPQEDPTLPHVATLILAVAAIIFFLHMESEVSATELALSETRFRSVFEKAATGIAEADLKGIILSCNTEIADSLGYVPDELVGADLVELVNPEYREEFAMMLEELRRTDRVKASLESRFDRKDGATIWGGVSLSMSLDFQGRPASYLVFMKDISGRIRIEEELSRHKEDLEGIVAERTQELADANTVLTDLIQDLETTNVDLDRANSVKSEFLAKMSHELRTPLNSVIGFSGVLEQGMAGPLTGEQKKQLAFIRNAGTHLLELVNDVLDLSKIEAQEMVPELEPVDIRQLLDELADVVERKAEEKGISFERKYDCPTCIIRSDRRFVYQIMANLAWNAVKFTHKGGVTLDLRENESEVRLDVIDTGVGIAAENMERVFEPFLQLTVDRTYNEPGSGLGLSISKQLAELLGGSITAQSVLGKGSTFTLVLPIDPEVQG